MRQKIFSMLPPGYRFYKQESIIVLPKPWQSEIHLKSADSGREKFQGAGLLACWFDEEPKGSQGEDIFSEVYARRQPGVPLRIYMTFTPLQGLSWSYRRLWDDESPTRYPGVETFVFNLFDCSKAHGGFLLDDEIETITKGYSEGEYEARVHGKYGIISGSGYFSAKLIEEAKPKCETGKRFKIRHSQTSGASLESSESGELIVYRPPTEHRQYIIGVDAAGGVGRDQSVCSVWDRDDLALCAEWCSNKVDAHDFGANAVLPLGIYYGNALVVVEANGEHGGTVINELRNRYHKLYRSRKWNAVQKRYLAEYGWKTGPSNRMSVFDALQKSLREGNWTPNKELLLEMSTVVTKDNDKVEHLDGCHDDRVFAAGVALAVHYDSPRYEVKRPEPTHYAEKDLAWMGN